VRIIYQTVKKFVDICIHCDTKPQRDVQTETVLTRAIENEAKKKQKSAKNREA